MKATGFLFALPLLCAAGVASAAGNRPAEWQSLVDAASGAPPEFSADALIRIANSDKLDKAWRIELLEDAFRRASGAKQPYRLRAAVSVSGGQSGFLDRAYGQELDRLSLEMRAVQAMLPLDAAKAKSLFLEVAQPKLAKRDCKHLLVPEVDRYYEVLARVAAEAFSEKEKKEDEPFRLLQAHITPASAAEVGPLARVLSGVKLKDSQFQALLAAYLAGLKEISGDDRTFTYARPSAIDVNQLKQAIAARSMSPTALLESYRAYLVRHLTATRCEDNTRVEVRKFVQTINTNIAESMQALNVGVYFNETLRADPVAPLTVEEQTPAKTEGAAEGGGACKSVECAEIGKQFRGLIFKPELIAFSNEEKSTAEWNGKLKEYLSAIAAWKEDTGFTATEHFRFKCSVFSELFNVVPNGSSREMVLRAMLDYLKQSRLEVAEPAEWFLPVNGLIARLAVDPLGLGTILEELQDSGDQIISLYAKLERMAPRPPGQVLTLF